MFKTDKEFLKENNIGLCLFEEQLWKRDGFYIPGIRTIFIKNNLTDDDKHKVLLHELGHIHHDPIKYQRLLLQYENQADRFMVKRLIEEELTQYEPSDFNWLQFANRHKISTSWGQEMIQEEFKNIVGI
ncbi:ImmA/IrrE family metallo-endopeptidase [Streptococcus minor]|uniref:ImmA/IrrE family metallo-endopeptidase n=1 Tax=Streptococcus minor TaxID=229549 RepID=UPI00035D9B71|nr:ImmA/IrrE family metallo-endopeptidase [Streptococcus minor]